MGAHPKSVFKTFPKIQPKKNSTRTHHINWDIPRVIRGFGQTLLSQKGGAFFNFFKIGGIDLN